MSRVSLCPRHTPTVGFRAFAPFLVIFLFFISQSLSGQIRISEIRNEITGFTALWAIDQVTGLQPGLEFTDTGSLETFLENVYQNLWNRRYYKTLSVTWEWVSEAQEAVVVILEGSETITLLPLPFYYYDSFSSHNYGGVLWAYNVLGSLSDLYMSGGRSDKYWDFQVQLHNLRLGPWSWGMQFRQWWKVIEKADASGPLLEYSYDSSRFSLNPPGIGLFEGWGLGWSVGGEWKYNRKILLSSSGEYISPEGFQGNFGLSLGTGPGANWVGNYKKGWSFGLGTGSGFNFEDLTLTPSFSANFRFSDLWGPLNFGSVFESNWSPWGEIQGVGGNIRGVTDSFLWGEASFTFKTGLGIQLFDWPEWLEVQLWTFFDGGITLKRDRPFNSDHIGMGTGIELLIFPHFFKSLIIRATIGFNLIQWGDWEWVVRDGTVF